MNNKTSPRSILLIVFLVLFMTISSSSTAAPNTNTFTGTAYATDLYAFNLTTKMNVGRYNHTATLLNNGKVLIAGGWGNSPLASAELYDPVVGTWNTTGSMNAPRMLHTAKLLNDGKVLVTGGWGGDNLASAEIYDPVSGTWSTTNSMSNSRVRHTATLLNNGKVLIAGGSGGSSSLAIAELYDPATESWSTTGSMNIASLAHTATLLSDGKVLVAGGEPGGGGSFARSELYDPSTGTWSTTNDMNSSRTLHTATLLNNGKVLVAGYFNSEEYDPATGTWDTISILNDGRNQHAATILNNGKVMVTGGNPIITSVELYDPDTGIWSKTGSGLNKARMVHTATLLNNGKVLITGGYDTGPSIDSVELGTLSAPANTFTGTLILPSGWLSDTLISLQFNGTASDAAVNAGALSNDKNTWSDWIATTSEGNTTATWQLTGEGADTPIYLRLRDINNQVSTVVTGTIDIDTTSPSSQLETLPDIYPVNQIALNWSGNDASSGVVGYDLQVRTGIEGQWSDLLTDTQETSIGYYGVTGNTYYFRLRAKDAVGNVEPWPDTWDTYTLVGIGEDFGVSINNGALFTNHINVSLSISARPGTRQMQVSNDGGFSGALWEHYTPIKSWTITQYGNYVIPRVVYVRFKDAEGNTNGPFQDDIILDVTPPTGSVTVTKDVSAVTSNFQISRKLLIERDRTVFGENIIFLLMVAQNTCGFQVSGPDIFTLHLLAQDDLSGVGDMMISNDPAFQCAKWEPFYSSRSWYPPEGTSAVYVLFRDNAGNISSTIIGQVPR